MQAVYDGPMPSHGETEHLRRRRNRAEIVACWVLSFAVAFELGLGSSDHRQIGEARLSRIPPVRRKPRHVATNGVTPNRCRGTLADRGCSETAGWLWFCWIFRPSLVDPARSAARRARQIPCAAPCALSHDRGGAERSCRRSRSGRGHPRETRRLRLGSKPGICPDRLPRKRRTWCRGWGCRPHTDKNGEGTPDAPRPRGRPRRRRPPRRLSLPAPKEGFPAVATIP